MMDIFSVRKTRRTRHRRTPNQRGALRGFEALESRRLLDGQGGLFPAADNPLPDFSLTDVNATSTSYNQSVSPRDYIGTVTGWYFGHAT